MKITAFRNGTLQSGYLFWLRAVLASIAGRCPDLTMRKSTLNSSTARR